MNPEPHSPSNIICDLIDAQDEGRDVAADLRNYFNHAQLREMAKEIGVLDPFCVMHKKELAEMIVAGLDDQRKLYEAHTAWCDARDQSGAPA